MRITRRIAKLENNPHTNSKIIVKDLLGKYHDSGKEITQDEFNSLTQNPLLKVVLLRMVEDENFFGRSYE